MTNESRYQNETSYNQYRDQVSDYNAELDRLTNENRYQSESDYNKYRDQVDDYNAELDRLTNENRYQSESDYNKYRDEVNDYNAELDRLTNENRYQSEKDYNQYRDQVNDYNAELDRLTEESRYQSESDYNRYQDQYDREYGEYIDERNLAYQQNRDQVEDEQWQAEFDEAKRQYDEQANLKAAKSGGSGSGSGAGNGSYTANPNLTPEQIKSIQRQADITVDGVWGPQTAAAYDSGILPEGEGEETTIGYKDVVNDIKGMSDAEALAHIEDARKLGYITTAEAKTLSMLYK